MPKKLQRVCNIDNIITLAILLVSLYVMVASGTYVAEARRFPRLVAALTAVIAAVALLGGIRRALRDSGEDAAGEEGEETGNYKHLLLLGMGALYLLLLRPVGFLIMTFALLLGVPLALGSRRFLLVGITAALSTVALYVVFRVYFYVPLPQGIVSFL